MTLALTRPKQSDHREPAGERAVGNDGLTDLEREAQARDYWVAVSAPLSQDELKALAARHCRR